MNSGIVQNMLNTAEPDHEKVRVIWQSPTFADNVWASKSTVPSVYVKQFLEALINLNAQNPEHELILSRLGAQYFLPTSKDDFNELIEISMSLNLTAGG